MKWLNVKKVILKYPHLRNLRKNLRTVLRLAIQDEIRRLSKLKRLYQEKRIQGKQVPSQRKREIQISRLSDKLMRLESKSCITCHEVYCESHRKLFGDPKVRYDKRITDLDLVWIPWRERWVCLECYEKYYKDTTLEDVIKAEMRVSAEALMECDDKTIEMFEKALRDKFKDTFDNK